MLFFKKDKEPEPTETKCTGCKCANCRFMRFGKCDYKMNECTPNKLKDCKIKECDSYRK